MVIERGQSPPATMDVDAASSIFGMDLNMIMLLKGTFSSAFLGL